MWVAQLFSLWQFLAKKVYACLTRRDESRDIILVQYLMIWIVMKCWMGSLPNSDRQATLHAFLDVHNMFLQNFTCMFSILWLFLISLPQTSVQYRRTGLISVSNNLRASLGDSDRENGSFFLILKRALLALWPSSFIVDVNFPEAAIFRPRYI